MQTLISIVGLGLLGADPLAALLVAAAVMAGVKKYKILCFTISFLLGTVLLGVFFSVIGQGAVAHLQTLIPNEISPVWAALNLIIIGVIIAWLAVRFKNRKKPKERKRYRKPLLGSVWHFIAVGILLALSAPADPTFYAVIVLAAQAQNILEMAGLHLLWISVSQIPLIAVVIAYYLNTHTSFLRRTNKLWGEYKQKAMVFLYTSAILLALGLLANTAVYLITGSYLF